MAYGYTGRILHVDLTKGKISEENPPESFYRQYMGGSGMGAYYVLRGVPTGADPLGPDNVLTVFVSPLTGVAISGQSRFTANAKSPLTGGIADGQAGGFFPAELKFAGFDGIVFTGRSPQPVYLWLHGGQAELRPAGHLWGGKTTTEVDALIKKELDDAKVEVAQCGPAGERLALQANIMNMANRANGRTGMGAVMGSKNLKAVVVRGTSKKMSLAHPDKVQQMAKWGGSEIPTHGVSQLLQELRHRRRHRRPAGGRHLPDLQLQRRPVRRVGKPVRRDHECHHSARQRHLFCLRHPLQREVEAEWNGNPIRPVSGGPEYESIGTLGSYCGVSDLKAVSYANQLCNEYGLDTIGVGCTIAWLMECFANNLISEKEIGFPVKWGDAGVMVKLVEMIIAAEGIGDVLALGSVKAAQRLGFGQQHLIAVKGAEAPAHMPQAKRSLAVIYAIQPFGADHQSHTHDPSIEHGASPLELEHGASSASTIPCRQRSLGPEKVAYTQATQHVYSFDDVACLCQLVWGSGWHLYGPDATVAFVRAVTGWDDFTLAELHAIGEQRLALIRVFNAQRGLDGGRRLSAREVLPAAHRHRPHRRRRPGSC